MKRTLPLVMLSLLCAAALQGATFSIPEIPNTSGEKKLNWQDQGLEVAVLSRVTHIGFINKPTGEAQLHIGWNPDGLLVYIKVHDPDRIEDKRNGALYRGDSIEIFLAHELGAADSIQILLSPGIAGSENDSLRTMYVGKGAFEDAKPEFTALSGLEEDGYWMQVFIPWDSIKIQPKAGDSVGFQMFVNDRDVPPLDTGDFTKNHNLVDHICWFPDRTTSFDKTRMQTLVLSTEPQEPILAETRLKVGTASTTLKIATLASFAGKTLEIQQDGKSLGSGNLSAEESVNLSTTDIRLSGMDAQGAPLKLVVDGKTIGTVKLYQKLPAAQAAQVKEALSTTDEKKRLALLEKLQSESTDGLLKADIATLMPLVEIWANGHEMAENGELADPVTYLSGSVNPMSPPALRNDSPLYPMFCLYRARNLIWSGVQGGPPEVVADNFAYARELLAEAQESVTDNAIINMYMDQPIPWPSPEPHPDAPAWANNQRVALEKLQDVVHWWVDNRQLSNGAYGADWGDDVEMWRHWWPVLFAFDDKKSAEAQTKLSTSIFEQPHMKFGYSLQLTDVEHSSEDSADTATPMLFLEPDNPLWSEKALAIADIMKSVWTGTNEQGQLQIKNIVFSANKISGNKNNAYDTTLDFRAVQPALVYWQQTRDPKLTPQFSDWLSTWVEAAASESNGKPAGILPTAIHWPDGRAGGPENWYDADAYSKLYNWPAYNDDALSGLLIGYQVTGDEKFLEPIRSMAQIRLDFLKAHPEINPNGGNLRYSTLSSRMQADYLRDITGNYEAGSKDWAAAQIGTFITGPLMSYRSLTGDTQFDEVLLRDGNGYMRYLITGNSEALDDDMKYSYEAFAANKAGVTSEVRWTDRLFRMTPRYINRFSPNPPPVNSRFLYSTATGDSSTWVGSQFPAVRWQTPPRDIAALVTVNNAKHIEAQLFHFGKDPRQMGARFPLLASGDYELVLQSTEEDATVYTRLPITVSDGQAQADFTLPAGVLCRMTVNAKP